MGKVLSLADFLSRSAAIGRLDASKGERIREIDSRVVNLARERGLDERTRRALDLVRFGLVCLLSADEDHAGMLDRMHAVYRGAEGADEESAGLRDVAAKVHAVSQRMPTPEVGAAMLVHVLRDVACDASSVNPSWLAGRLRRLRSRKVGVAKVVAEITWRTGTHGADGYRRRGDGDEPSDKWVERVRGVFRRAVSRRAR